MTGRAPDFLVIGAQKCGTSWLHHQLRQSNGIFMPADKDVEHFSYVGHLNPAAFARYCERFAEAGDDQRVGDANAGYFWTRTGSPWSRQPDSFNPDIPGSIRDFCGSALRLILLLRDPVERAISAYLHHLRHGAVTADTSILDRTLPLGIIDMSLFRVHLQNWLAVFPREQLHIVPSLPHGEQAGVRIVEDVCRFLDAPPPPRERYYLQPVFPGFKRVTDDSGVWLSASADYPGRDQAASLPSRRIGGKPFVRVVSPEELCELHAILDAHRIG